MLIFSITLIESFVSNDINFETNKWKIIKKDLEDLKKAFEKSKYSKSKYHSGLKLYTAGIEEITDNSRCDTLIFDCYHEEFKVVVEELSMSGEEHLAKEMRNILDLMLHNRPSEGDMTGSCKKCEEYEEESFETFLESFKSIAQKKHNLSKL